ncbi:transcriptional activator NhaR [Thalassotalea agariperforans]
MAKLNYHHLHYFYTIAKMGSIIKASEVLHITPQTLSHQLTTLENQLGYPLFERRGKRLILNEIGHVTYSYAAEIFNLGDELTSTIKNRSKNVSTRFSIGVSDVIAKVFAFNFLKTIYTMDDEIKLVCKETNLEVLLSELAINKLDAILTDSPLPNGSAIKAHSHLLGKSGFSFFAHQNIVDKLTGEFPQSLNGQMFFMTGEGSNQKHHLQSWFEELNLTPIVIGEFDDATLAMYFSQAAYGIFCAPTITEQHVLEQFDVKLIGKTNDIEDVFYLISPDRKIKHPAIQHIIKEGKKLFDSPMI